MFTAPYDVGFRRDAVELHMQFQFERQYQRNRRHENRVQLMDAPA